MELCVTRASQDRFRSALLKLSVDYNPGISERFTDTYLQEVERILIG